MTVMRERAARWGGAVRVRQRDGGGTSVLLTVPLPTSLPATNAEPGQ
jgi:nitrate/nitrite-specific signal transduction histidine kinase